MVLCAVHICCHGNGKIKLNKSEINGEKRMGTDHVTEQ